MPPTNCFRAYNIVGGVVLRLRPTPRYRLVCACFFPVSPRCRFDSKDLAWDYAGPAAMGACLILLRTTNVSADNNIFYIM